MPEDGEPVRVLPGGLDGDLVGVGVPAWGVDHRAVDAGCRHLGQQFVPGEDWDWAVRLHGCAAGLDKHLGVDDPHWRPRGSLVGASVVRMGNGAMSAASNPRAAMVYTMLSNARDGAVLPA
jgi:hypothetical protein